VRKKEAVLVGFHERKSRYVADIRECHVVPTYVSDLLLPLRGLIASMDAIETCPQIELACGVDADDPSQPVIALVLRHLEPLSSGDTDKLRAFAASHAGVQWWLQPKGPDTVHLLEAGPQLAYTLPEFGITMPFKPTDFTQVNPFINQVLVSQALRLLAATPHERVIDWFCGLGNFTLPLATQAGEVMGIEGSEALVARSRENLEKNRGRASAPTRFAARNLFEMTPAMLIADGNSDKWLVDPPRDGALALIKAIGEPTASGVVVPPPSRIVYVSCSPATLARDAGLLVHTKGYVLRAAGVVNMFPHTGHVESVAWFERCANP
jgi:23S rRNA (uracil1939-C5)-methyltransferase